MNGKRLLILAAFAAFATIAMPSAFAGVTSNTVPITVKWNTQALGSLVINTNYSATGAQQLTAPSILTNLNGGTGACTANGAGSEAAATVNYGNVSASSGAQFTNCQYKNAWDAEVTSNDPNSWVLAAGPSAAFPAGYSLCSIPNGTWTNNVNTVTQSSAATATSITSATACPAGDFLMTNVASTTLFTGATATAGTNLGADMSLVIPTAAGVGAQTVTENFTLVLN